MNNLIGDRFLRLFTGNLQCRLKGNVSNIKDLNTEVITEGADELVDPTPEEGDEKNLAKGNILPGEDEQN